MAVIATVTRGANLTPQVNGVLLVFVLPEPYVAGSLVVHINGIRTPHFAETSATQLTFLDAPRIGDEVMVQYEILTDGLTFPIVIASGIPPF